MSQAVNCTHSRRMHPGWIAIATGAATWLLSGCACETAVYTATLALDGAPVSDEIAEAPESHGATVVALSDGEGRTWPTRMPIEVAKGEYVTAHSW